MLNLNMISCLKLPQFDFFQNQKRLKDFKGRVMSISPVLSNLGIKQSSSGWTLYPPIYPRVNGRTLSVQGDKLVTSPAPKITAKLKKRRKYQKERDVNQKQKNKGCCAYRRLTA